MMARYVLGSVLVLGLQRKNKKLCEYIYYLKKQQEREKKSKRSMTWHMAYGTDQSSLYTYQLANESRINLPCLDLSRIMFFISSCVDPTELKCNMLKSVGDAGVDEDANNLVDVDCWNWIEFEFTRILKFDDECKKEVTVGIAVNCNRRKLIMLQRTADAVAALLEVMRMCILSANEGLGFN